MSRIVVIDDEEPIRHLLAEALATRQHEVESFGEGRTALAAIFACPPDLIICDVNMPGLSGYQLLDAVRRNPATAVLPVLLITGRDTYESMQQGMVAGADDYLPKPFTTAQLFTTVDQQLGRQAARRLTMPPLVPKLSAELQMPLDAIAAVAQQLAAGGATAEVLAECSGRLRQAAAELQLQLTARRET